ncbi:hypothetical protein GS979_20175 [Rhodococcus hoagii]|nr:hypothetical protein [Prescottella equi]NKW48682.1 hypothetical protein [Prescottella equi]
MDEQTPVSAATGDELAAFYREKAAAADIDLEHDDEVFIGQAAATLDLIAALQRDLDEHGVMLVGATGTAKVNPASVEVRQQRVALTKLTTLVAHRIEVAASGVRPVGVQPGSTRGPYGVVPAQRRGTRPNRRRGA